MRLARSAPKYIPPLSITATNASARIALLPGNRRIHGWSGIAEQSGMAAVRRDVHDVGILRERIQRVRRDAVGGCFDERQLRLVLPAVIVNRLRVFGRGYDCVLNN